MMPADRREVALGTGQRRDLDPAGLGIEGRQPYDPAVAPQIDKRAAPLRQVPGKPFPFGGVRESRHDGVIRLSQSFRHLGHHPSSPATCSNQATIGPGR